MSSKVVKLVALLAAVVAEVFLFLPLTRAVRFLMKKPGDVGSVFPAFWLLVVLPGAAAFVTLLVTRLVAEARRGPDGIERTLNEAWLANGLLWIGSAVGYNLWMPD